MTPTPIGTDDGRTLLVERAWKWRAYPTSEQELLLEEQAHAARGLWNLLHEWYYWGGRGRYPSWKQADAAIRAGRREIDWLAKLPAQACQQVLASYQQAWSAYFAGARGRPDYHSRERTRLAIDIPQSRDLNITNTSTRRRGMATVNVPLVGKLTVRVHRPLPAGTVTTGARLVREPGGAWSIALRVKVPSRPVPMGPRPAVGLDRGIAVPVAGSTSHGTNVKWEHGSWLTAGEKTRLRRLERAGARKRHARWTQTGRHSAVGKNEKDTYEEIAKLRARAARRRKDWQEKVSREIADTYVLVGLEKLSLSNMTRSATGTVEKPGMRVSPKRGLNRGLLNEGHAALATKITYKTQELGGVVRLVPAPYTSLRCHVCRSDIFGKRESQAFFECQYSGCGWSGNADDNASANILLDALTVGKNTVTPMERGSPPVSGTHAGRVFTRMRGGDLKVASGQGNGKTESATTLTDEAFAFRRR